MKTTDSFTTETSVTAKVTLGLDLFVRLPAGTAPAFLPSASLRATPDGLTIYALPRFVGDRRHSYCVLDSEGEILAEDQIVNDRACLEQLSRRFPSATIAMETGTHSPWISRLFQARGHQVYVANARKLRAISQSNTKSDQAGAEVQSKASGT